MVNKSVSVGLASVVFLASLPALGQTSVRVVERVPAVASLAVVSGDIAETCAEFQQTQMGEVLGGPAFSNLIDHLRRHELGGPLNLRPLFGFDWRELQTVHQPVALVVFPVDQAEVALACIFSGTESQDPRGPLPMANVYFASQGFTSTEITRGEVRLTVWKPPASREDERERVLFSGPGYYGVADSTQAADVLMAVTPATSLARDPLWPLSAPQGTVAEPRAGDVTLFLRPFELWEESRSVDPKATEAGEPAKVYPEADDALASSRHVGFDAIKAIAGSVSFPATGDRDWQLSLRMAADKPFEKALRLFEFESGSAPEIPDFLLASVTSASFWRWDFPRAMQGFGTMFDEANEPGPDGVGLFEDMLDGLRDDPEGVQVDLRREVFERLGPEIWNVTDRQGPKTEKQPHGDRALYVASVREVPQVADALQRFYAGDDRVAHQRLEEYDLWTVPDGASLFVEGESDSVVSIRALALGEGRMLFSTDPEQLREALTGGNPSDRLKDDPTWQALWQPMVEGEAGLWGLARLEDTMAPEYAAATAPELADDASPVAALWRILLFGTTNNQTQLPVDQAPAFNQVRPGLSRTSTRIVPAEDGLIITITGTRQKD